ncbi:MAG: Fur family transcriptional regulator [Thermosulfidibacteraceae bacterium]|jgi:Fe2+ or Zn2+ uptake regulation protein
MLRKEHAELRETLIKHNIKPTAHKIRILKFLMEKRIHPTIDEIYREIRKTSPPISRTTIYNILNDFAEKGIVNLIKVDVGKSRYDIRTEPHAHFRCILCGGIFDIELESDLIIKIENSIPSTFSVDSIEIIIEGKCHNCKKSQNQFNIP